MLEDVTKACREPADCLQDNFIDLFICTHLFRIGRTVRRFRYLDCVRFEWDRIKQDLWARLSLSQQHQRFVDSYPRNPGGEPAVPAKAVQVLVCAENRLLKKILGVLR